LSLIEELKRRNVFKVAIAYIVMAWLVLQVADVILNNIAAPGWIFKVLMLFLAIGLPFAVFFAWAFELTPEGLKREHEVDRARSITTKTGRKLNLLITSVLVLALGYFAYDKFVLSADRDAALIEATLQTVSEQTATEKVSAESDKSIAVLPFVNMSEDTSNEYFSDGISEELLNLLAKIPELRVIGRTSSFQFKDKNEDLRVIGEMLGVANILEGSVRKSGNTVRVTAQLINAENGAHLWSDTYDRNLDDVFKVQDEIAEAVVSVLKVKLLGEALPKRATPQLNEAYDLYLKGRYFYTRLGAEYLVTAQQFFEQAVEADPELALAWDGLAAAYIRQILNGQLPPDDGMALTWNALDRAVALDATLSVTHYRIGFIRMIFDWDWPGANTAFTKALAIDPNFPDALSGEGLLSILLGQKKDAIDYAQRGLQADPLRSSSYHNLGFINYQAGNYPAASAGFRNALELSDGSYTRGNYYLSLVLLAQGKLDEALAECQKETGEQWRLAGLSVIHHAMGRNSESRAALEEMSEKFGDKAAYVIASAYAFRDEIEAAFEWLDRAYAQHDPLLAWMKLDPLLKNLEGDPRLDAMLQKMNLGGLDE
jgi:TolB-like protein/tetratricopeptide (TPR) repeat protein